MKGRRVRPRLAIQALFWVFCTGAPAAAQPAAIRAELNLRLHWIQVDYGKPIDAEGVILRGEPIELELRVSNHTSDGPETTAVEVDWHERIAIRLEAGGSESKDARRSVRCDFLPNARSALGVERRDDMLLLPRRATVIEICRLRFDPAELAAGAHTLEVNWAPSADMTRFRKVIPQQLPRRLTFEYRDVATTADQLDLSIHLARRALDNRRIEEAAAHAERVLGLEPMSTSGLVLRGEAKLASGDCRAAAADWTLAASVLENNADVLNRRQANRTRAVAEQGPERTARELRTRVERLRCK